jgi:7-keto-8-aminopelargonate synthetase-like enzyme
VIGPEGRGSAAALGLQRGADVTIGTLGKALGTAGAFVAGSRVLIEYLQHRARSFVFSTASSPALATATLTALHIARDEEWRRERLHENARMLRTRLRAGGLDPGGDPDSAIVPVPIGDPGLTMRVAARLERDGMIVGAIRPPTVPAGTSRLRITVSASHEPEHLARLCTSLAAALVPDDA